MSVTQQAPAERKIGALQTLRGIAVILTVMAHLPMMTEAFALTGLPAPYWMGVSIFYGISGFIIALTTETKGWDYVTPFYVRRLSRILPVLLLTLAIAVLMALALPHFPMVDQFYPPVETTLKIAASHLVFLGNVPSLGLPAAHSMLGLWSISVEAQFYLFFGLALLFGSRMRPLFLLVTALGIFAVKLVLYKRLPYLLGSHVFFYEILFCSAALCAFRDRVPLSKVAVVLCAVFTMSFPWMPKTALGLVLTYPVLVAAVSYIAVCAGRNLRFLMPGSWLDRFLTWNGERSYVIYVFHFQIIAFWGLGLQALGINFINPHLYGALLTVGAVAAMPFYELIHRTVERAGIDVGHRYSRQIEASLRHS